MAWIQCYSEVAAQPRLKWTRLKWMFAPPPICVLALQPTNKTLVVPCRERHAVKMGWGIATSCLICVFGLALWLAVWGAAPLNSRPLPMRDALGPGPGFFPVWLSIIGLSLGALLGLQISRQPAEADTRSLIPERAACARIAAILALLAVAALALDPLGFRVASFVFSLLADRKSVV